MRKLLAVALVLATSGCATAFSHSRQSVTVESVPTGKVVRVDGAVAGRTPVRLNMSRKSPGVVTVEVDGCAPVSWRPRRSVNTITLLNFPVWLAFSPVAFAVDFATGSMFGLPKSQVAACAQLPRLAVGMAASEVRRLWGDPSAVNRTETAYGTTEQWVYSLSDYVYVEKGVVTALQTTH